MAAIATTALHWGPVQFGRLVGFCQGANHDKSCRSWKLHLKWSHRQLQKWNFKRIFHPVFTEKKKKTCQRVPKQRTKEGEPEKPCESRSELWGQWSCLHVPLLWAIFSSFQSHHLWSTWDEKKWYWMHARHLLTPSIPNQRNCPSGKNHRHRSSFAQKKIQSRRPILSRAKFSSNHFWSSWVVSCPLTREATKPAMKPSFDDFWVRGCALVESGGRTESFWRLFSTHEGGLVNVTKTRNPSWTLHKKQKCDKLICNSSISIFRSATHLTSDSNSFRPLKILQKLQVGRSLKDFWTSLKYEKKNKILLQRK